MNSLYLIYLIAMLAVVGGHFFFSFGQWFRWPEICRKLTKLTENEAEKTKPLGRSFAAYNASIGLGLCLSFLLPEGPRDWTQIVVLALVAFTAVVGASGTEGKTIFLTRFAPAIVALIFLVLSVLS